MMDSLPDLLRNVPPDLDITTIHTLKDLVRTLLKRARQNGAFVPSKKNKLDDDFLKSLTANLRGDIATDASCSSSTLQANKKNVYLVRSPPRVEKIITNDFLQCREAEEQEIKTGSCNASFAETKNTHFVKLTELSTSDFKQDVNPQRTVVGEKRRSCDDDGNVTNENKKLKFDESFIEIPNEEPESDKNDDESCDISPGLLDENAWQTCPNYDINPPIVNQPIFGPLQFMTAAGRAVHVSDTALLQAQQRLYLAGLSQEINVGESSHWNYVRPHNQNEENNTIDNHGKGTFMSNDEDTGETDNEDVVDTDDEDAGENNDNDAGENDDNDASESDDNDADENDDNVVETDIEDADDNDDDKDAGGNDNNDTGESDNNDGGESDDNDIIEILNRKPVKREDQSVIEVDENGMEIDEKEYHPSGRTVLNPGDWEDTQLFTSQEDRSDYGRLYTSREKFNGERISLMKLGRPKKYDARQLKSMGVLPSTQGISGHNAMNYMFNGLDYFGDSCLKDKRGIIVGDGGYLLLNNRLQAGVDEFQNALMSLSSVKSKISKEWVRNHYRWIVWKLASYEMKYPEMFAYSALTPNNVMFQLKYRYDVEFVDKRRSALWQLLEHTVQPDAAPLVLCVADIQRTHLVVTDGWYAIKAIVDCHLANVIETGKLTIGTKIMCTLYNLIGCPSAVDPLEAQHRAIYLDLCYNSTRRAPWYQKLGFAFIKVPPVPLNSIRPNGGAVHYIKAKIVRCSPAYYQVSGEEPISSWWFHVEKEKRKDIEREIVKKESDNFLATVPYPTSISERTTVNQIMALVLSGVKVTTELVGRDRMREVLYSLSAMNESLRKYIEMEWSRKDLLKTYTQVVKFYIVCDNWKEGEKGMTIEIVNPSDELREQLKSGEMAAFYKLNVKDTLSNGYVELYSSSASTILPLDNEYGTFHIKFPRPRFSVFFERESNWNIFGEVTVSGILVDVRVSKGSTYVTIMENPFDPTMLVVIFFKGKIEKYCSPDVVKDTSYLRAVGLQWREEILENDEISIPILHACITSSFQSFKRGSFLPPELAMLSGEMTATGLIKTEIMDKCISKLLKRASSDTLRLSCTV